MRLKTHHGTYVVTGQDGQLLHLPESQAQNFPSVWNEALPPIPAAGLTQAAITEGPLAPSTLVAAADGLVAFWRDGFYLCAEPSRSKLHFDRRYVAEWECFAIEETDGAAVWQDSAEQLAQSPDLSRPMLIETLSGYQIMREASDTDLATVTWPDFSSAPINRYSLPDGSWIVDVDNGPGPDLSFLVYWFCPFKTQIHVWRLDRSGKRLSGYDLSDAEARSFLLGRQAQGPAFTARLYMLSQRLGDRTSLTLLNADVHAAAEAGSAEALYAVLRNPYAFPQASIRRLAARAFHEVRATNLAHAGELDLHLKGFTAAALAEALSDLDPDIGGVGRQPLQVERHLRHIFAHRDQLPDPASALPFTLHHHTEESLASTLDGYVTSGTLGILVRPQKRTLEFHYINSEFEKYHRILDCLRCAFYALSTNQDVVWEGLAARDATVQVWKIRFEVDDMTTTDEPSASQERFVGDTRFALVPDIYYFRTAGFRRNWFAGDIPHWTEKSTCFLWRGSTTGAGDLTRDTIWQVPRVRLCEVGRALGSVADFGITHVVQTRTQADVADIELALKDQGLWREPMPQHIMGRAKFLIEIDGNANSWGFFAKLLMGCCVLKVDSPYEQWFYDRLQPWVHYVPIAADLSDLSNKVQWCLKHEETCRKIAEAGHKLAESLGFEQEMAVAAKALVSVAYNNEDELLYLCLKRNSKNPDAPKTELIRQELIDGQSFYNYLPINFEGVMPKFYLENVGRDIGGPTDVLWFSNIFMKNGLFYSCGVPQIKRDSLVEVRDVLLDSEIKNSKVDRIIKNPSFLITSHKSAFNFYHFLIDFLPRMSILEKSTRKGSPFMFSPHREVFQDQAMSLLLGKKYPIYEESSGSLLLECGVMSRMTKLDAVDFYRERSSHVVAASDVKRIYVARRNASWRRIINETDLEPILQKLGFKIIYNEDFSLEEQISLFKSADFVCGPHGAGLTNIVFCKKNTSVLEIIMEERFPVGAVFWELACAAELDYHILPATRVPVDESHLIDGNMYVDPKRFEAAIEYMINQKT